MIRGRSSKRRLFNVTCCMQHGTMATLFYNGRFLLLLGASFFVIFWATATYFCMPILISHLIRQQISISPTSGSFKEWQLNTIPVIDSFYLYNITNIKEILEASASGGKFVKIKLNEVGPISYIQTRYKQNIEWNPENGTVLYNQYHRWNFRPDLTVNISNILDQTIHHMNLPLAGTTLNSEYAEFINPIVEEHSLKLFLNHSIGELMFGGYPDILMENAKASGQIDIDKFGWLYNQNDTSVGKLRVFTGAGSWEHIRNLGLVDQYNFANELSIWEKGSSCNQFKHSSAGDLFPPPMTSTTMMMDPKSRNQSSSFKAYNSNTVSINHEKSIYLFLPDVCRTIKLVFNGTRDFDGLTVDRYAANELTFSYQQNSAQNEMETPELLQKRQNQCYCILNDNATHPECPPDGMMDLKTCRKGSPLTISFPHFLYLDDNAPFRRAFEDDVVANENDHQFYMDLESTLNIPVRVQATLQFNLHFKLEPKLDFTNDYKFLSRKNGAITTTDSQLNDIYVPQMWFKSSVKIDSSTLEKLKFLQNKLSYVTPIVTIVFFSVAFVLMITTAMVAYRISYEARSKEDPTS